jgi:hypothetical protein
LKEKGLKMQIKNLGKWNFLFVLFLLIFSYHPLRAETSFQDMEESSSDILCQFTYDSKGNPESFPRAFPINLDESLLIGQMTVQIQTKSPADEALAKQFTLLNFSIWDDSGSELSNQPYFQAKDILISASHPVIFQVKVRNLAVPDYPEVYQARCSRRE